MNSQLIDKIKSRTDEELIKMLTVDEQKFTKEAQEVAWKEAEGRGLSAHIIELHSKFNEVGDIDMKAKSYSKKQVGLISLKVIIIEFLIYVGGGALLSAFVVFLVAPYTNLPNNIIEGVLIAIMVTVFFGVLRTSKMFLHVIIDMMHKGSS
jgi:hypothetical protein